MREWTANLYQPVRPPWSELQEMLWVTGHPSHTPQAPSSPLCGPAAPLQGEMAAAELGVLWQRCPPLISPPALGCQGWCLLLQHCPALSILVSSCFLQCQERALTHSITDKFQDTLADTKNYGFVSLKGSPIAVFFSISGHVHPNLFLMQGITIPIFPGFLQADFCSFCQNSKLAGLLLTSLVKEMCCHKACHFCSRTALPD